MKKGKVLINVDDVIGKCLGKLKVISYEGCKYDATLGGDKMRHYYRVECECGNVKLVQRGQITSNIVHSCGCLRHKKNRR